MSQALLPQAISHVSQILTQAIQHTPNEHALIIYDTHAGLTRILADAYRTALPHARCIDFDHTDKDAIIAACAQLHAHDLVILIQSTSFRLDAFRIRLHLFTLGLKVIEHSHLGRNSEDTWGTYIDALEYDPQYYRTIGPTLQKLLAGAQELRIVTAGSELLVTGGLEDPKLNIGDYSGMKHVGGSFPIGEVFTEAKDFSQMNGSVMLDSLAQPDFCVAWFEPFRVDIVAGLVVGWSENAPKAFCDVLQAVQAVERPLIREIGFGLNRSITRSRPLCDIGAYERNLGIHLSIGEKHSVYKKPGITSDRCRFHVDVFPVVESVSVDETLLFSKGMYRTLQQSDLNTVL